MVWHRSEEFLRQIVIRALSGEDIILVKYVVSEREKRKVKLRMAENETKIEIFLIKK